MFGSRFAHLLGFVNIMYGNIKIGGGAVAIV
jgi:hypothetical protein